MSVSSYYCAACVALSLACGMALCAEEISLPGTDAIAFPEDMAAATVSGVDRFLLRALEQSVAGREKHWQRDLSSAEAFLKSTALNRQRLSRIVGLRDARPPFNMLDFPSGTAPPAPLASSDGVEVWAVGWPALDGIRGEGLLVKPKGIQPRAWVIAIPDCTQTPEMLAGIVDGLPAQSQLALRLAERGCGVLVPALIDRGHDLSVFANGQKKSDVTHREMLYRGAYQMGRHLLGYEVQKVLAGVDWIRKQHGAMPEAVVGYGEGGLIAMFAGALDPRIDCVGVSGCFDSRQDLWQEPIDRNLFGLLSEFGDAEVGSLIAPRTFVVEVCRFPEQRIPSGTNSGPGRIVAPPLKRVQDEFERMLKLTAGLPGKHEELIVSGDGSGPCFSPAFVKRIVEAVQRDSGAVEARPLELRVDKSVIAARVSARRERQFHEILQFNERLIDEAADQRRVAMDPLRGVTAAEYPAKVSHLRQEFHKTIIGEIAEPRVAPHPRTRLKYDQPEFRGYEVVLDVYPDVVLYGILLVPRDIKAGERRPVVVCQHGLEGRAVDTVEGDRTSYRDFAAQLARRGFVTFSPQHLYRGGDSFRTLQRKANPLGLTLFSIMTAQHQQLLDWLGTLEFVDSARIGFYGISYGGKSAMRIPAVLDGYALSICSSDFSDWIWRTVSSRHPHGYLGHSEYEIFEFDLGTRFNYAEIAALICPRPFMVERFHANDLFVERKLAEYSKIQLLYQSLGLEDRTSIAHFANYQSGTPLTDRATFHFLHRHLKHPEPGGGK